MEYENVDICRHAYYPGLHQRCSVLLAEPWCGKGDRLLSPRQSQRFVSLEAAVSNVCKLTRLIDIEKAIGVAPLETISIHPMRPIYEACCKLMKARARRVPVVDDTKRAMVVSVLTQYRILKFIAVNVGTQLLRKPLREIPHLGTYGYLQTAAMETPVIEVIHQLVKYSISSVPIVNSDGS